MPLDIMPAPAALPSAAPPPGPAGDAPPGGAPLTGSAALLFGLLLAQTVGQAGASAPPVPGRSVSASEANLTAANLPNAGTVTPSTVPVAGHGDDKKAKKDRTPAADAPPTAVLTPSPPWTPLAPPIAPAASLPKPDAAGTADATKSAISGKVMDTVPATGGELLSPPTNSVPAEVDLVPTETSFSALPRVPIPTATPSQAVMPAPSATKVPVAQAVPSPVAASLTPRFPDAAPVASNTSLVAPQALPSVALPAALATVVTQPSVSAALAVPPAVKNVSPGTALSVPLPPCLQNRALSADNQPGKSTDSKSTGLPAPTAKVAVEAPPEVQTPAAKVAAGEEQLPAKELLKGGTAPASGHEAHTAETPAPTLQTAPVPTQTTAAAPMPPADRTQMLAQVAHSLEAMPPKVGGAGPQQVTLQLHPKDWGQLNVRVTMTPTTGADGSVTTQVVAHVIAEHPAVKAALETGQTELRQSLREAGLHLDRLTVTVQAPAAGAETNPSGSRQESRSGENGGGGQPAPFGAIAQGGSSFGGQHPAPFAALAQGQSERQPPPMPNRATGQAGAETEAPVMPATTRTGRVDTRA